MSWAPQVKVVGEPGWHGNGLRFATKEEAEANAKNLSLRWTSVTDTQAAESNEPVNYRWDHMLGLVPVKGDG